MKTSSQRIFCKVLGLIDLCFCPISRAASLTKQKSMAAASSLDPQDTSRKSPPQKEKSHFSCPDSSIFRTQQQHPESRGDSQGVRGLVNSREGAILTRLTPWQLKEKVGN